MWKTSSISSRAWSRVAPGLSRTAASSASRASSGLPSAAWRAAVANREAALAASAASRAQASGVAASGAYSTGLSSSSASVASPRASACWARPTRAATLPGSAATISCQRAAACSGSSSAASAAARSAALGSNASRNCSTTWAGWAPTNSATIAPSLNALTAGMPCTWKASARRGAWSTSSLASTTSPPRAATPRSSSGPSARQGAHHSAQKSTTTGTWKDRCSTAVSKSASVTSKISWSWACAGGCWLVSMECRYALGRPRRNLAGRPLGPSAVVRGLFGLFELFGVLFEVVEHELVDDPGHRHLTAGLMGAGLRPVGLVEADDPGSHLVDFQVHPRQQRFQVLVAVALDRGDAFRIALDPPKGDATTPGTDLLGLFQPVGNHLDHVRQDLAAIPAFAGLRVSGGPGRCGGSTGEMADPPHDVSQPPLPLLFLRRHDLRFVGFSHVAVLGRTRSGSGWKAGASPATIGLVSTPRPSTSSSTSSPGTRYGYLSRPPTIDNSRMQPVPQVPVPIRSPRRSSAASEA